MEKLLEEKEKDLKEGSLLLKEYEDERRMLEKKIGQLEKEIREVGASHTKDTGASELRKAPRASCHRKAQPSWHRGRTNGKTG